MESTFNENNITTLLCDGHETIITAAETERHADAKKVLDVLPDFPYPLTNEATESLLEIKEGHVFHLHFSIDFETEMVVLKKKEGSTFDYTKLLLSLFDKKNTVEYHIIAPIAREELKDYSGVTFISLLPQECEHEKCISCAKALIKKLELLKCPIKAVIDVSQQKIVELIKKELIITFK